MPYIIVVIALVVASVGFTFFQSSHTAVSNTPSEPLAVEQQNETAGIPTPDDILPDTDISTSTNVPTEENSPIENPIKKPEANPKPAPTPAPTPSPAPAPVPTPSPAPAPVPVNRNTYKNGTYSTKASYRTPDGQYQMNVSVSVADDKITNSTVTWNTGGGDGYSKAFARSYQSTVVGQDLGSVHPSRIGGASLTTRAFNSALDNIRSQAV